MRFIFALCLVAAAASGVAAPASALSLVATGATLSPFQPDSTALGTGSLSAVVLTTPWTITVQDSGAGAGHLRAAGTGCTGSSAQLTNSLTVTVTSALAGITSAGAKTISATPTTVATGTAALATAGLLTTSYNQVIPASQVLLTGCVYSLTATYTLQ